MMKENEGGEASGKSRSNFLPLQRKKVREGEEKEGEETVFCYVSERERERER